MLKTCNRSPCHLPPSVSQSGTQQLTATGIYSDGSTKNITGRCKWNFSNPTVATVGVSTGLATGISAGNSQITATIGNVSSPSSSLVVVNSITLQSIAVAPSNSSVSQTKTQQFSATGTYSDGSSKNITTSVAWTSSNSAVATIGASTGLATGTAARKSPPRSESVSSAGVSLTVVKSITLHRSRWHP